MVVYEMSIHVFPTAPSPTTTHFISLSVLAILEARKKSGGREGGREGGERERAGRDEAGRKVEERKEQKVNKERRFLHTS